ncbi:MAG: nuclear transport factor 2 family protein, partial [Streptococcaceae bacterium]|nr:nuclear transport factor 2 family protein [Streptococcaceae bacterium]
MEKVVEISRNIWQAMKEVDEATLINLVHENAEFVHMTRTLDRTAEIGVMKAKNIIVEDVTFIEHTVRAFGDTQIILNRLDLHAIVRGNVAVNSFVVTE